MTRTAIIKTSVRFLTLHEKADLQSSSKGLIARLIRDTRGNVLGVKQLDVLTTTPIPSDGYKWVEVKDDKNQQGWIPSEQLAYEAKIHNAGASSTTVYSNPFAGIPSISLPNGSKVFVLNYYGPASGFLEVAKLQGSRLELLGWVHVDDLNID